MDEKIWYYAVGGEQRGPLDEAEIATLVAASVIQPDTLVWRNGMADWASAVSVLPDWVRSPQWATPPPVAPPPAIDPAQQDNIAPAPHHDHDESSWDHPVDFMGAVRTCFANYATFSGRARRPEFWYFALFNFVASLVLNLVDISIVGTDSGFSPLSTVFSLAMLLPSLAVGARRLHDIGRSGWWQLIMLIPLVGFIILIVWYVSRGDDGANRFGPA